MKTSFGLSFRAQRGVSPGVFSSEFEVSRHLRLLGMTWKNEVSEATLTPRRIRRIRPGGWRIILRLRAGLCRFRSAILHGCVGTGKTGRLGASATLR